MTRGAKVSSPLFTVPLRPHLEEIENGLTQQVKQLSEDDLLGSPSSTLAERTLENALPPVPVLNDQYAIDRIPGRSVVDFRVPVNGDEDPSKLCSAQAAIRGPNRPSLRR